MYYYNFHIGDYKTHTHHLSLIEDLAFRRLLDLYYTAEKPIIGNQSARLIGMREHEKDVLCVLNEFFTETPEGFINKRADEEIAAFHAKIKQASLAGQASAAKRLNKSSADVEHEFNDRSTTVQPTNNHKPITSNHTKNIAQPDGFAEFWGAWPKRVGKAKAVAAWKKHKPPLQEVLAAIDDWLGSEKWTKDGGKYIPDPATWLNASGWEDELSVSVRPKSGGLIGGIPRHLVLSDEVQNESA